MEFEEMKIDVPAEVEEITESDSFLLSNIDPMFSVVEEIVRSDIYFA